MAAATRERLRRDRGSGAGHFLLVRHESYGVGPFAASLLHADRVRRAGSRQQLIGRFGNHNATFTPFEAGHQADVACGPQHFVPGQPHAVRWPHLRIAEMLLQLLRGEDILFLGPLVRWIIAVGVKGVDGQ
jgi:hypothetical protein